MGRTAIGATTFAESRAAPVLRLSPHRGRWRGRRHLALAVLVGGAGWFWLGGAGALPLLLWWWLGRPGTPVGEWCIDVGRVRGASLGRWRTRIDFGRGEILEVFCDEVDAAQLARLRRELKRQLATG